MAHSVIAQCDKGHLRCSCSLPEPCQLQFACTWNGDPLPTESGDEAKKVLQLLLVGTQDWMAGAVVNLSKSQLRNKLKGIRPQLMKKITSVVLIKVHLGNLVQVCNSDKGSDCYMFSNSEVLQDMCNTDHFQTSLSCHSFLDWGCVQCSHGRALVSAVFYLRKNCPSVPLLGHKFT